MDEQQLRQLMDSGFEKIKPKVGDMVSIMMDCYQQGFKDCWKVLTGKDFE